MGFYVFNGSISKICFDSIAWGVFERLWNMCVQSHDKRLYEQWK